MQDFVHQPYHITSGLAVRLGAVPGGHGLQDENGTSHTFLLQRALQRRQMVSRPPRRGHGLRKDPGLC